MGFDDGKSWRNWKSYMSQSIRKVLDDGVNVSRRITLLKSDEPSDREWDEFVKNRSSDQFKELSQMKQAARTKQAVPCTLSRKVYARYEHDWANLYQGQTYGSKDIRKGRERIWENQSMMLRGRQFRKWKNIKSFQIVRPP